MIKNGIVFFLYLFCITQSSADTRIDVPEVIEIPAGEFLYGSTQEARQYAYHMDEQAYGHSITRKNRWYENEPPLTAQFLKTYSISKTLITNQQYAAFIMATGHPAPIVSKETWDGYGLIHPFKRTLKHQWFEDQIPEGRQDHPVVLVSHNDAVAYAIWLSTETGQNWRLPTELEWEKAARGVDGNLFPWGKTFNPALLNSHDLGPFDTTPVGRFPKGASPYGMQDMAGQVFEWTATPAKNKRFYVKGGSWDDRGCGICRSAARHSRPDTLKHILIGFRLVRDTEN